MIKFISYGKGISILLIVFIHVFLAYYNSNSLWARVTNVPMLNNVDYPDIINFINDNVYSKLFGFLVAGSVSFFFLSSGFTFLRSKEGMSFPKFWKKRLLRLIPFYYSVMVLNVMIYFISTVYFDTKFDIDIQSIIWQLFLGVQYYIPGGVVLDLVIWFVAVLLLFYFIASIIFRNFTWREVVLFDVICALLLFLARTLLDITGIDNFYFLIKALCFSIFISISLVLSMLYYGKLSGSTFIKLMSFQVLFFLVAYRVNSNYINYIDVNDYFVWFSFYILLFSILFLSEKSLPDIKFLFFLDKISFSLYISHGVVGYFILMACISSGLSKDIAGIITLFCVIIIAYLLNRYIEKPLYNLVKNK